MALQFINSPDKDFSRGIDVRSAENQIDPGFVKDLLNADVVEKRVRKRTGYQGYAGNIPIRITRLDYNDTTNEMSFTLDSAVSLDSVVTLDQIRSSPIVVYGRSSEFTSGQGPITDIDSAHYYSQFTVPTRKLFTAPGGTLAIPSSEHGLGTTDMFISVAESTSLTNRDFTRVLTDRIEIDDNNFDVDINYTTYIDKNVYVYFADKSAVNGSSYVATINHTGSGSETFSIPTSTHNLTNYNIVCQLYQDSGSASRLQVVPEQLIVEPDGDVSITINAVSASTYYLLLSAAPIPNVVSGVVGAGSTGTVVISSPEKPWVFFGIYLEQTPGGNKELVYPDTIDYDEGINEFTLSFTNLAATARNFIVFYEYGDVRSNRLSVIDSSITVTGTDLRPQLTLWGLDHSEIYASKLEREGWSNHIDSYRRSGEQRLITGLGGNLFSAREHSEAATTYLYPTLYPNLFARTSANKILGPLFYQTGDTPQRTRGYITGDDSATNWARVTAVFYLTGSGRTRYRLSLPNMAILDSAGLPTTISSVISTTTNLNDFITIQGMSYARHNGTFRIAAVTSGVNVIDIDVENDQNNSTDWDDSGTGGEAGVFTDQISWLSTSPFIPGDSLQSTVITSESLVRTSLNTITVADGFTSLLEIPAGVLFNAERTSSVIPFRSGNPESTPSSTNLVRGDMLSYSGPDILNSRTRTVRELRVLEVNPDSNRSIDISGDGTAATVTMTTGDTTYLAAGKQILLLNAGSFTGVQTVQDILTTTTFTFASEETDSITAGLIAGETAQVDESFTWEDTPGDVNYFRVERRWIPVEVPDDSFNQTPTTYIRHFDVETYANQPFLRSTMVVDNMYLTNYEDEPYKFDGTNLYRSGLPAWQPGAFLTQETTGAVIVTNLRSVAYSAIVAAEGKLTITADTTSVIPVGSSVRLSGSTQTYTVRDYSDDGTVFFMLVDRSLDVSVSATGTVSEIGTYRHYYRLNAVDANDNIIASAVTGHQDHVVELTGNAAIQHKLVGFPSWDAYDFDRLEVQIYRTKMNQVAPFYLVTTLPLDFDNTQGYVQFKDAFTDSDLTQLDVVTTALKGQELGTAWAPALRSKYVTSVGNRLVLGNVQDFPQFDIQIVADATVGNSQFAGDTLLFRKDNTDSSTTTNMVERVKYQWINGFTGTASAFSIGTNEFSFTTSVATGAVAGDWIYLTYATVGTTSRLLTYSGWWQIESVVGTTVTVNLTGAAIAATYPDRYVIATDPTDVPVLLGVDGNLGMVNGDSFDIFDSMRRMSMAINASMRMVDTSLTGMNAFSPWLMARGGNDLTPAGRLNVRMPRSESLTPELVPTFSGYDLFVNQIKRSSGVQISASTNLYPSRVLISYENYPEIFDNPTTILDTESDSAIDINSADGQEITGIIPFFGEAAFGAAQQSQVLVVFKTNSIYLVDISQKALGSNSVQRIETEGLGCTAPYSIAVTKNGIMFANESGIYCLRRNQAIQYIGRYMERNWTEKVDLTSLELVQGHHYGVGRVYKISVPIVDTETSTGYIENSQVYVYNHTGEAEDGAGSWGRYDNHPATGWANLNSNAFFGATLGRVFMLRNTGLISDFRDDNEGITFSLETRPNDFGNSGIRKVLDRIIVHYRIGSTNTGTSLNYSVDLEEEYSETTSITITRRPANSGMDDIVQKAVDTISHSVGRRRGTYFAVQILNAAIDENLEIAGIDFKIGGLSNKGQLQAGQTEDE